MQIGLLAAGMGTRFGRVKESLLRIAIARIVGVVIVVGSMAATRPTRFGVSAARSHFVLYRLLVASVTLKGSVWHNDIAVSEALGRSRLGDRAYLGACALITRPTRDNATKSDRRRR